ncbi:MAG: amidoligase family protein [Polyangiaceae bacterium]|nr:amidoligase family protein [Polyangiaceae bacterium]
MFADGETRGAQAQIGLWWAQKRDASVRDPSCGIHVHIDGSRFDARGVTNLVKMVHKQERLIEQALGISETRLARYCRPVDAEFIRRLESRRPRTMQEVSDAWYGRRNANPDRYDSSRYHGVNLNSRFLGARSS